ncbi:hypothetical protein DXB25_16820 [Lachnospiraceae bacterium OM02-31]|nr:hypothetical protein DXB25_16820 [Lachnospiraceae bacterium OM02-31]RJW55405.1 hypothetical protein DXB24_20860 [Lachnospiraceae bacterium OM02-3]
MRRQRQLPVLPLLHKFRYLTRFLNLLPECGDLLEIPEGCKVYGTLMAGYPANQNYRYIPAREKTEIKYIQLQNYM